MNPANDRNTVELHVFCDCSSDVYGVAIFICEVLKLKQVHTTLSSKCWLASE